MEYWYSEVDVELNKFLGQDVRVFNSHQHHESNFH